MSLLLSACLAGAGVAAAVGVPAPRRAIPSSPAAATLRATPGVVTLTRAVPASPAGLVARWLSLPAALGPAVVGLVCVVPLGPAGAAVAALVCFAVRHALRERSARAGRSAERSGAAEALAVLAAELRAGRAPVDALDRAAEVAVGPSQLAFAGAATTSRFGGSPHEVLVKYAADSAMPDLLRGLAACWQVCQGTGSSLAAAVDRLEEGLRAERIQCDAVEAELAGPRATAMLLATLPALGILMAAGLGARPLHVLLHTFVGSICLVLGVLLDLLGLWWTGRIVAAAGGTS